jgi:hypothetical protein
MTGSAAVSKDEACSQVNASLAIWRSAGEVPFFDAAKLQISFVSFRLPVLA